MKLLFTFFIVFFSLLNAGEVQRIESIVSDINKLKSDYSRIKSDLVEMEVQLEEEKAQNKILHQDLKLYSNYTKKEENYKNKITSLENKIKSLEKSVKIKEKNKIVCKITPPKIIKTTVIIKKDLNSQTLDKENKFPSLLMKEQFATDKTKAYSYRVKTQASIYDARDGKKIDSWETSTSFTSNERTSEWIKITGYFIDKVWTAASKEMWIRHEDALKRAN